MNPWKRNKEPPDLLSSVFHSLSASSSLDLSRFFFLSYLRPSLVTDYGPILGSVCRSSSQLVSQPRIVAGYLAWLCRNYGFCHALDLRKPSALVPLRGVIEFGPFAPICSLARSPVAAQARIRPAAMVVYWMEVRTPTSSSFKRTQVSSLPPLSSGNFGCYSLSCLDLVISFLAFPC